MATYSEGKGGRTIQEMFEEFHKKNPHIYKTMRTICLELISKGFTRFSLETVWERMRWLMYFETAPVHAADYRFKLNDVYASRYARLLMQNEARLRGFFSIRKLRSP